MDIEITGGINSSSLQINDEVYFVSYTNVANQNVSSGSPTLVGVVNNITSTGIIEVNSPLSQPQNGDFLMLSKNKAANNTSIIGYYAEVKLKNNSTKRAELYALSSEVAPSSK